MQAYINSVALISPQHTYDGSFLDKPIAQPSGSYFSCIEPAYKDLINPVQLRRMSRILKMGLGASRMCMNNANEVGIDAVVVGTGLACIADLEKFLQSVIYENEQSLSPIPFINSSHNTVAAQIAMVNRLTGYNSTYCHRGASFESALQDALMLINEGTSNVLVGGIDEYSQHYHTVFDPLYKWDENGIILGEGSGFFMLSKEQQAATYARLTGVHTFINPKDEREVSDMVSGFLAHHGLSISDIDMVVLGKNGDADTNPIYTYLENGYIDKDTGIAYYKHLCGEYMTSTAFALWLSALAIKGQQLPSSVVRKKGEHRSISKILIYNHYNSINHSLILVESDDY